MSESGNRMSRDVQEAERLGHNYIGCEHLLLGVLANEESPATKVLATHGVALQAVRDRTDAIVGDGGQDSCAGATRLGRP